MKCHRCGAVDPHYLVQGVLLLPAPGDSEETAPRLPLHLACLDCMTNLITRLKGT